MAKVLKLTISDARPVRRGQEYFWSLILDLTRETDVFTYADVKGMCDQDALVKLRDMLRKLEKAGFLGRLPEVGKHGRRPYRLLRRQSECPVLTNGSVESKRGRGIQHMWNVMRRARHGFTAVDLAVDASTDDVVVSYYYAKQYCALLKRAGILGIQRTGQRGVGGNVYVLLGSANTGPKPPRPYRARFVYDPNRCAIVGAVTAEEENT